MDEIEIKTESELVEENKLLKIKINKLIDELEKLKKEENMSKKIENQMQEDLIEEELEERNLYNQEEDELDQEEYEEKNNIMLGLAGSKSGIGTTHAAIELATYLYSIGKEVALIELNDANIFLDIKDNNQVQVLGEQIFEYRGIDFYPNFDVNEIEIGLRKDYDFLILDYGKYNTTILDNFFKCDKKILVAGAKSWELGSVMKIFASVKEEILEEYVFLFNHVPGEVRKKVLDGMDNLKNVYFMEYHAEPFEEGGLEVTEEILKEYLPEVEEEQKISFFRRIIRKS